MKISKHVRVRGAPRAAYFGPWMRWVWGPWFHFFSGLCLSVCLFRVGRKGWVAEGLFQVGRGGLGRVGREGWVAEGGSRRMGRLGWVAIGREGWVAKGGSFRVGREGWVV